MSIETKQRVLEMVLDRLHPAGHMKRVHHLGGDLFGVSCWNQSETTAYHVRHEADHLALDHIYPSQARFTKAIVGGVAYLIGPT